ncbi:hypothetical protein MRX96_007488 [Rhipicephalus microplus]
MSVSTRQPQASPLRHQQNPHKVEILLCRLSLRTFPLLDAKLTCADATAWFQLQTTYGLYHSSWEYPNPLGPHQIPDPSPSQWKGTQSSTTLEDH